MLNFSKELKLNFRNKNEKNWWRLGQLDVKTPRQVKIHRLQLWSIQILTAIFVFLYIFIRLSETGSAVNL